MPCLYHSDDEAEITELVENLLKEGTNLYGEPSTYPGLQNRLTSEEFTEDFRKPWRKELQLTGGKNGRWVRKPSVRYP